jgi:glycosyltransferase involved in cell wall biosynthesis
MHNRADLNLCTSRPVQAMLRERNFRNVALWEPGVDGTLFSPERRSSTWRVRLSAGQPEATLLLYVGRLAREKGLDQLAPVLPKLPGVRLALVGEGPAEAELRGLFAGLPVTFVGKLQGEDLAAAYASADIFVFPSSTETLGLVTIEAMSAGLPVVGARRGGTPDLVLEGETGHLFDPDAPGDLERALLILVGDPAERQREGQAARRRAEGWGWTASTAGLRRCYQSVLAARAALLDASADVSTSEAAPSA